MSVLSTDRRLPRDLTVDLTVSCSKLTENANSFRRRYKNVNDKS